MARSLCRIVKRVDGLGGHCALVWHRRDRAAAVNAEAKWGVPQASRFLVMERKSSIFALAMNVSAIMLTCPQVLPIGGEASRFLVITHKSSIFALAMNVSAMRFTCPNVLHRGSEVSMVAGAGMLRWMQKGS